MALSKNLRRFAITVICVTLIGGQSVFAAQEVVTDEEIGTVEAVVGAAKSITIGTVNCDVLNVRSDSSTEASVLGKLYFGTEIQLTNSKDGWYYMDCSAGKGWVFGEYISNVQTMTEQEYQKRQSEVSDIGKQVAAYSKQFLGKPYASGGVGPNSFDCSGFVRYVYGAYGVSVPHSSKSISAMGQAVSLANIQPGDIMCFATGGGGVSHVGIYVGNGQLIHASTGRRGVTYDGVYDAYYAKTLVKIVRIV